VHSPWVVVQARRREAGEAAARGPRVAVAVGRGLRTAVARNRVRRAVREACRAALGGGEGPWDLVLIARPGAAEVPFAERVRALSALLREAGVGAEQKAVGA